MDETVVRALIVAAILVAALAVAFVARHREQRRARRSPLDLRGLSGTVVFFSDTACFRCRIVRSRLDAVGVEYTEVAYDREPEVHRRVGVIGVPLVVIRDEAGSEVRRFAGVVSKARLAAGLRLRS